MVVIVQELAAFAALILPDIAAGEPDRKHQTEQKQQRYASQHFVPPSTWVSRDATLEVDSLELAGSRGKPGAKTEQTVEPSN
jgi:hypothetical protein